MNTEFSKHCKKQCVARDDNKTFASVMMKQKSNCEQKELKISGVLPCTVHPCAFGRLCSRSATRRAENESIVLPTKYSTWREKGTEKYSSIKNMKTWIEVFKLRVRVSETRKKSTKA